MDTFFFFHIMGALLGLVFHFTMYNAVWLPSRGFHLYIPMPRVFTRIFRRSQVFPRTLSLSQRKIGVLIFSENPLSLNERLVFDISSYTPGLGLILFFALI